MWIAFLDHLSYNLDSFWHRTNAFSKIIFLIFVITAVIFSTNSFFILAVFLLLLLFMKLSHLPVLRLGVLLLYPLFFGLVFALSRIGEAAAFPVVTLLRAVTAASAILLVLSTTPYVTFFATLQHGLPMAIGDVLLITYRSFFLMLDSFRNTIKMARLRGAYRFLGLTRNLSLAGRLLGHSFIHAYEANETTQLAMNVRGYEGQIVTAKRPTAIRINDFLAIGFGILLLVLGVIANAR